jgi:hypothetical protein
MPRVGFEPTAPVYERAKTVHGLDGAATVPASGDCEDGKFGGMKIARGVSTGRNRTQNPPHGCI